MLSRLSSLLLWPLRSRRRLLFSGLWLLALALAGLLAGRHLWALHHLRQAERALERRDHAAARDHLEKHLRVRPGHARARFLAARAARHLGKGDEAAEHLSACRRLGWDEGALRLESLLAAAGRGSPGVEPELRAFLASGPGREDELEALEPLIQRDLDGYRLHQALEGLNRYLELRPTDLHALLGRAFVRERLLYFRDAVDDYRRAVAHHPDNDAARLRLGKAELIAGTPGEAREQFVHLHRRGRHRPEALLGLGQCARRLGNLAEAKGWLDELLRERPADPEGLWERGQVAWESGDLAAAEGLFRQAARAAPHDRKAHASLAQCLRRRGKVGEAEGHQKRAERIDANLKRLDRLTRAVLAAPDDPAPRCAVGLLFLENGQEAEGARWLEQALRLDPGCHEARRALARYARRKRGAGQP
jgi:tetratricopeptide (TPR) repeat protein